MFTSCSFNLRRMLPLCLCLALAGGSFCRAAAEPAAPPVPADALQTPALGSLTDENDQPLRPVNRRGPLVAMIDFESTTLDLDQIKAISQALWTRLDAMPEVAVYANGPVRRWLIRHDLFPFTPYMPPVSAGKICEALKADYLVTGRLDRFRGAYDLDLSLYSARAKKHILNNVNLRKPDLDGLLQAFSLLNMQVYQAILGNEAWVRAQGSILPEAPGVAQAPTAVKAGAVHENPASTASGKASIGHPQQTVPVQKIVHTTANRQRTVADRKGRSTTTSLKSSKKTQPGEKASRPEAAGSLRKASGRLETDEEPYHETATPEKPIHRDPDPTPNPTPRVTPTTTPTPRPTAKPTPTPTPRPATTPSPRPTVIAKAASMASSKTVASRATPAPAAGGSAADRARAQALYEESLKSGTTPAERLRALEQAVALIPDDPQFQQQLALECYNQRKYDTCIAHCDKAIQALPQNSMMQTIKGSALFELARYAEAVKAQETALQLDPKSYWAAFNLALALGQQQPERAVSAWRNFLTMAEHEAVPQELVEKAKQYLAGLQQTATGSATAAVHSAATPEATKKGKAKAEGH